MRVLVVHGSKMGGTEGIAHTVHEQLVARGFAAEIRPARKAPPVDPFDAVVVGGALYANRWHRDARRFVRRNAAQLRNRPVWLFSSGPLDDSAAESEIPPVRQVDKLIEHVAARGHATFGGRLEPDAKGFPARSMAKKMAGDWRDRALVEGWADQIADVLEATGDPVSRSTRASH